MRKRWSERQLAACDVRPVLTLSAFNGKNRILSHQLVGMPRFPKHAETHRILTEPRFLETHTFFNA